MSTTTTTTELLRNRTAGRLAAGSSTDSSTASIAAPTATSPMPTSRSAAVAADVSQLPADAAPPVHLIRPAVLRSQLPSGQPASGIAQPVPGTRDSERRHRRQPVQPANRGQLPQLPAEAQRPPIQHHQHVARVPPLAAPRLFAPFRPHNRQAIEWQDGEEREYRPAMDEVPDEPIPRAVFGPLDRVQLGCEDSWRWSKTHRSCEAMITGPTGRTAFFHPNWSKGTAGVRGTRVLNNGRYYWEIHVTNRIFGTSMMFGIGTGKAKLHANNFTNLLGSDAHSWGLSHKGILWHGGVGVRMTRCFQENLATTIGLLYDGLNGTLTYYKDGVCLGIAFRELNKIQEPIYPIVTSTAAKTEMVLGETRRQFINLQDRCRAEICRLVRTQRGIRQLQEEEHLPPLIGRYLAEALPH